MQLGLAFWGSKTLLSAVELGVFTELAEGPVEGAELTRRLGLHQRGARDFLDALVALGMLRREGSAYANTEQTGLFLVKGRPTYVGGMLEMANHRLYPYWGSLTEALRTGLPQNELKEGGELFANLYADPKGLEEFLSAMSGISLGAALALAEKVPWDRWRSVVDVGTAQGAVPVQLARAHGHLEVGGFDLPPVEPVFRRYIEAQGMAGRVAFHAGDFFTDPLPSADVLVMGHILHDWDLEQKRMLIGKAYEALPENGALVVYEAMIDDDRSHNAFGLLMSLNMLVETPGGFDYTGAQCGEWLREAGFREIQVEPLVGPDWMVMALK